jgi:hypothetical protein
MKTAHMKTLHAKEPSTMPRTAMSKYPLLAAVGVTALSLAACGSSTTSGSPTSSNTPSGAPSTSTSTPTSSAQSGTPSAQGKDHVAGLIASVAGTTIQVTRQSGTATVAYSPTTRVTEVTAAQLTDVTPGSCVAVRPAGGAPQSGGAVTARMVSINAAANGQCQPPRGRGGVGGTVSLVNGNTIVVNATDSSGTSSQTNVQVDNTTRYAKLAVANSQAIAQGKCIAARGTNDASGTLQATAINLHPATNGTCPQPNAGRHHGGG